MTRSASRLGFGRLLAALCAALLLLGLALPADAQQTPPPLDLATAPVTITTKSGETHVFRAEIADDKRSRERGLMYRDALAADAGMLFIYDRPQIAAFWMRNTRIPLDIIFIKPDGEIRRVHAMAKPFDETSLPSGGAILSVLEIQGGLAEKLGVEAGDRVASPALSPLWRLRSKAASQ